MIVAIDCEYIPANAAQGRVAGERPDVRSVYCEIMQIGACAIGDDGQELGLFNRVVSAHRIAVIPPWLSKMTGMTSEHREQEGVPFPQALLELSIFCGCERPWTFSGDWFVMLKNAEAHGIKLPFSEPFERVKPLLPVFGITLEDFNLCNFPEACSGGLHRVLGIELPAVEGVGVHDAAHDARSLAHSIFALERM